MCKIQNFAVVKTILQFKFKCELAWSSRYPSQLLFSVFDGHVKTKGYLGHASQASYDVVVVGGGVNRPTNRLVLFFIRIQTGMLNYLQHRFSRSPNPSIGIGGGCSKRTQVAQKATVVQLRSFVWYCKVAPGLQIQDETFGCSLRAFLLSGFRLTDKEVKMSQNIKTRGGGELKCAFFSLKRFFFLDKHHTVWRLNPTNTQRTERFFKAILLSSWPPSQDA